MNVPLILIGAIRTVKTHRVATGAAATPATGSHLIPAINTCALVSMYLHTWLHRHGTVKNARGLLRDKHP